MTRYKNWHEKNQPPNLDDMYAEAIRRLDTEDYDFSTLSEDHQDVYNLINYQQHPKTKMKDLSSGAISPKSFWAQYHATIGKFSEEDRFKQWENQIKGLPELFSTKQSSGFSDAFVDLAPTVGDQEIGLSGVAGMNTPIGRFQANLQGDKSLVGDGFVAYKQDDTTGLNVPIGSNTSFVAERRPAYDGGKENYLGVQYNKRFQEGGEVQDDVGIPPIPPITENPALTSKVLPDAVAESEGFITPRQEVDKTEGFYKYNPAPNESAADFAARMPKEEIVQTKYPFDPNSSFRPPAGYISPRSSNLFESSSTGTTTTTTGSGTKGSWVNTDLPFPKGTGLSASQQSALNLLGISNDILAAEATKIGGSYGSLNETFITDYLNDDFGINNFNPIDLSTSFTGIYGLDDTFTDAVNVELQKEFVRYDVKTLEELKVKLGADAAKSIFDGATNIAKTNQIIDEISNVELDTTMTFGGMSGVEKTPPGSLNPLEIVGGVEVDILEDKDFSNLYDATGNPLYTTESMLAESTSEYVTSWAENLTPDEKDILIGNNTDATKWFDTISNKTIGNMYGHEIQVKDLYDEFGATLFVGLMTEDWGKAALAGKYSIFKNRFC